MMHDFLVWFFGGGYMLVGALTLCVLTSGVCIDSGDPNARTFGWILAVPTAIFILVGFARLAWDIWDKATGPFG